MQDGRLCHLSSVKATNNSATIFLSYPNISGNNKRILYNYNMQQNSRNYSIDALRILCAFFVVILHCHSGEWTSPLTRCAVPIFLMISGYLIFDQHKIISRTKKSLRKTLKLCCVSTLFFSIYYELLFYKMNSSFFIPTRKQLLYFFIFNENPFGYHLWYLFAFLYALLILWVVAKYNLFKKAFAAIPILLALDLIFGKYSYIILKSTYPYVYVRNFICVGFPYLLLGAWIKQYESKLKNVIRKNHLPLYIALFTLTSFVEKYICSIQEVNPQREHYLSTTLLSLSLFLTFLFWKQKQNIFSQMGQKYSLLIYIIHPVFILISNTYLSKIFSEGLAFSFMLPTVTFLLSLFCAALLDKIFSK